MTDEKHASGISQNNPLKKVFEENFPKKEGKKYRTKLNTFIKTVFDTLKVRKETIREKRQFLRECLLEKVKTGELDDKHYADGMLIWNTVRDNLRNEESNKPWGERLRNMAIFFLNTLCPPIAVFYEY